MKRKIRYIIFKKCTIEICLFYTLSRVIKLIAFVE